MRRWGHGLLLVASLLVALVSDAPGQWAKNQELVKWLTSERYQVRRVDGELQIRRRDLPDLAVTARDGGEVLTARLPIPAAVRAREWDVYLAATALARDVGGQRTLRQGFEAVSMEIQLPAAGTLADVKASWPGWIREIEAAAGKMNRWSTLPRTAPEPLAVWPLEIHPGVVLDLVWIPPTTSEFWREQSGGDMSFFRGSPGDEAFRDDDETRHAVTLDRGFWLGRYEVTQEQWLALTRPGARSQGDRHPAEGLRAAEIQTFLNRLNQRSTAKGFRLPTEAEWEYASRAGQVTAYSFGDDFDPAQAQAAIPAEDRAVREVGTFPANPWGLHDLHGNVSEWVQDTYAVYPETGVTNPVSAGGYGNQIFRGGSYLMDPRYARSAFRGATDANAGHPGIGFRVARDPTP